MAEKLADLREIEVALAQCAIKARVAREPGRARLKVEIRALVETARVIAMRRTDARVRKEEVDVEELLAEVQRLKDQLAGDRSGSAVRASSAIPLEGDHGATQH